MESTGDVGLSIVTEDEDTLIAMLGASELDVIAGPFPEGYQGAGDFVSIPLISDQLIAVVRPQHPLAQIKRPPPEELLNYAWVAPKPQGIRQEFSSHPILQRMKIVSENYNILKKLATRTDAICAGPRAVFREELAAGQLREVDTALGLVWGSCLLTRHETYATPLAKALVDIFQSVAAAHRN